MLALYRILILDTDTDDPHLLLLKQQIYHLIYMDNGAISTNTLGQLKENFNKLNNIFNPYKFHLQQFVTNSSELQTTLDESEETETPKVVKLLGIQ